MADLPSDSIHACAQCQGQFTIIRQEKVFYEKKDLPWPTMCPDCRQKRRLSLKNGRKLYKRPCAQCQAEMITTYPPDTAYRILCEQCFWKYVG